MGQLQSKAGEVKNRAPLDTSVEMEKGSEKPTFHTLLWTDVYQFRIMCQYLLFTPISNNLSSRMLCSIEPNAFSKSNRHR